MKKLILSLSVISLLGIHALEFQPLGHKSISMGGAGVALSGVNSASYYNPALLSKSKYTFETSIGGGLGIRENNVAKNIDILSNLDLTKTIDNIAANAPINGSNSVKDKENIIKAQNILKTIGTVNGLNLNSTAFVSTLYKNFSLSIYNSVDLGASLNIDANKLDLVFKNGVNYFAYNASTDTYTLSDVNIYNNTSIEAAIENKDIYLNLKGISLLEVPISFSKSFDTKYGSLSIGNSLKFMYATTYSQKIAVDTNSEDLQDKFDSSKKTSSGFGLDMGVLFTPLTINQLSLGLVAKNINAPKFDNQKVDPLFRAGIAYDFTNFQVALDVDLSKNKTSVIGYDSQYIGGGVNFNPSSWFSLRAGAMKNMADSSEGIIYTTGIGFGAKWLQLDISGQVSSKKGSFDGEDIPKYAKVNVAIVSKW